MSALDFLSDLASVLRAVRPARFALLLLGSLALALAGDWLREERVIFPAPLPTFTTVPAHP
jgi:hypothetical protein